MSSKRSTKPRRAPLERRPAVKSPELDARADWPGRPSVAAVLLVFVVVFVSLQVWSYTRTSATWDEPGSLAAGYAALASRDYRPAIEHPPLTRLWAALPLLFMSGVSFDTRALDSARPEVVAFQGPFDIGHRFLYKENNTLRQAQSGADGLLYRARFMNVLLGVLLGVLVFCWAGEWLGFRAAVVALALYTIEPNISAHSSLVTTDLGVACFMFGAVYFLWRASRRLTAANIAGLVVCFVLAILSKFSAAILGPVVLVLMAMIAWRRGTISTTAAVRITGLLIVVTWFGVWAAYGFRFAPSATPGWVFALHNHPAVQQTVPAIAAIVGSIDSYHLLPNAFSQGFLYGQGLVQGRPSFLAGSYSNFGWWYYFPVAFLIKTPLALLALFFAGAVLSIRRGRLLSLDGEAFLVVPIVFFLGVAMTSALNIGLRHILPIYPFVIVLAALAARALIESGSRYGRATCAGLLAAGLLEFGSVYPNNLAFFNRAIGGPSSGFRWLADSNIDWGQDLKPLKGWMDRNQVAHINLAYFGVADPAHYGIDCTYMGGTTIPGVTPSMMKPPRLPGYVAVSVTLLNGVPFGERDRDFYKPLRDRQPAADIGGSIRVYWVEKQWWRQ
jgi:4-amino-4-deoxy-L-arabinose transferase-like glycosyltransferase